MQSALTLAKKGRMQVSPNPMVGCVIVKDNQIVGEGFHEFFGGPHAEINALKQAGTKARDAEMFVSLEPCCHQGKTPPCTEKIIQAGIKKVYVAMLDPNPLVSGKGVKTLQAAGIQVEIGLLKKEAQKLNAKFIYFMQRQKPFVALKMATTLDGKITRQDSIKEITNAQVKQKVHQLRSEYDAILVGKNTVMQDNPRLTSYLIENGRNPLRIILDSNGELLGKNYRVFEDENFILYTKKGLSSSGFFLSSSGLTRGSSLSMLMGQIEESKDKEKPDSRLRRNDKEKRGNDKEKHGDDTEIDLNQLLAYLGKKGISSLLVEGGAQIFTSFLNQNLAQKIYHFQAPFLNGKNGLNCVGRLDQIKQIKNMCSEILGDNLLIEGDFS